MTEDCITQFPHILKGDNENNAELEFLYGIDLTTSIIPEIRILPPNIELWSVSLRYETAVNAG